MAKTTIKLLVSGGKASAGPPLGPSLAPMKLNIADVVAKINEMTKDFSGIDVPVEVIIDKDTKEFEIKIGSPPIASLIKKELKVEKLARAAWGTYTPKEGEKVVEFHEDISFDQVVKIAKSKEVALMTHIFKNAVKEVIGTCLSCGVTINGKNPKEILREINAGNFDDQLK
ncbi:MAG: 50S ribosomal protein L11 [Nanoarchaeota archaeon]|nr:50S ribosomal protein L11 [Nanoarchaeota archaeon]MBU4123967.1 50S ribosomal protein L11 [Nanoarchaeota archaeon]